LSIVGRRALDAWRKDSQGALQPFSMKGHGSPRSRDGLVDVFSDDPNFPGPTSGHLSPPQPTSARPLGSAQARRRSSKLLSDRLTSSIAAIGGLPESFRFHASVLNLVTKCVPLPYLAHSQAPAISPFLLLLFACHR
jgi:hypothetical protein